MNFHIALARFMIRLGTFLQSSAVMVMPPDDLVEFSRRQYAKPTSIESWIREDVVDSGLYSREQQLVEHLPVRTGQLLLLGVGGGREAIPLAKMGFEVTGVDFIPAMVESAIKNAKHSNVEIRGLVQEISTLAVPAEMYDVIWLSPALYSVVPTQSRRVRMLQRAWEALKPGGYLACQFQWDPHQAVSKKKATLQKIIALITLGNRSYESGDMLWGNIEFVHAFSSEQDLIAEFRAARFEIDWLNFPAAPEIRGQALLQKELL
jgi:2-polyprenyl-3-methyl-5-hydroxy-6-metoxy-1,4-benzoquinol methylase